MKIFQQTKITGNCTVKNVCVKNQELQVKNIQKKLWNLECKDVNCFERRINQETFEEYEYFGEYASYNRSYITEIR